MKVHYLYRIYYLLARSGLEHATHPHDRKSILFINKMSLVNTSLLFAFSLTLCFFKLYFFLLFTFPFIFLFALPPFLNKKGALNTCRYYFAILPILFLIGVCVHNGSGLGDKYLILTTATIPLILFTDKRSIYGLFALNMLVFFLIEWYQRNFPPLEELPEFISEQYFIFAELILFTVLFFVVQYFRMNSEDYETELELKNKLISEKNHEIIDSITYAQRLQCAILPPDKEIYDHVPESFILYKPKDIVAGDFYFADQKGDHFFIAAADCTGHGVPGAMVSIICSNALKRAVDELELTKPGEILDKVREFVVDTFKKSAYDVKDGMDISMAVIDLRTRELLWAGANNPLWYIPVEEEPGAPVSDSNVAALKSSSCSQFAGLKEIAANKQPVGKSEKNTTFTTHTLHLGRGSMLYLFTDGFADQFGGPKGKKFMYKQLAELIVSIRNLSMMEQKIKLEEAFLKWKGDHEQIDDVCIIGFKL